MNQPKFIKLLVLGLPLGLFGLGAFSMIWHFRNPHATTDKRPKNEAQSKPISAADLEFNVTRLGTDLANRPISEIVKTRQTASFLEGSLGINNIGYPRVTRTNFPYQDREVSNLLVEVKGTRSPEEIILVVAHYDSAPDTAGANANGTGVAATLALANLFLRTTHPRTVQFHFLANALGPPPTGPELLAKKFRALGSNIVATLVLDQLGTQQSPSTTSSSGPGTLWSGLETQRTLLEHCSQKFTENSTQTGSLGITPSLPSPTAQAFATEGIPTVLISAGQPAADAVEQIDLQSFSETVRGLGRTLQSLADEESR